MAQHIGRVAFEPVYDLVHCESRREADEEMHVVRLYLQGDNPTIQFSHFEADQLTQPISNWTGEHPASTLRTPDQVVDDAIDGVASTFTAHVLILAQMFNLVKSGLKSREEERHSPPR